MLGTPFWARVVHTGAREPWSHGSSSGDAWPTSTERKGSEHQQEMKARTEMLIR